MRRLVLVATSSFVLLACEKGDTETTKPYDLLQAEKAAAAHDDDIPDYSKSACVGQKRTVNTRTNVEGSDREVEVVCQAEGGAFRLWVEPAIWENIKPADFQSLAFELDLSAPLEAHHATTGTIGNVTETFGVFAAEKLDDGKLPIYVVDGETPDRPGYVVTSPKVEIHIDPHELAIDHRFNVETIGRLVAEARLADIDADEEPWLVAALSYGAASIAGIYGVEPQVDEFLQNPNRAWGEGSETPDPGASKLFGSYLAQRLKPAGLEKLAGDAANGWESLDALLATAKTDRLKFMRRFYLTLWFANPDVKYGFKLFQLSQAQAGYLSLDPGLVEGKAEAWGPSFYMVDDLDGPNEFTLTADAGVFAVVGTLTSGEVKNFPIDPGTPVTVDFTNSETSILIISADKQADYKIEVKAGESEDGEEDGDDTPKKKSKKKKSKKKN